MVDIDYKKCFDVVKRLEEYFSDRDDAANIEYPSSIEYSANEYFIYMFYSCLLDYGMRSKLYHNNLVNTYNNYPQIFNPEFVVNMEEEELRKIIINNIHPRYPNVAIKKWISLSNVLSSYDNLLEYLKEISSFNELCNFVRNIKGFGQKTGGLLIRIISDSKICNFREEVGSIPIDRHDIEISFLTGIISTLKVSKKDIELLSDTYVDVCKKCNINPSDIDKYLWEVGSSFCNNKNCLECPLSNFCSSK